MVTAPMHVLVIDDAEELRSLFRDVLEEEGCRVSDAATAPDVETIARLAPDLVVLDLLLGSDGDAAWCLLRALRRDARLAALPVIVCSAATALLRRLRPELEKLGTEVLPKPFDLDELLAIVARCRGEASPGRTVAPSTGR